MNYRQEYEKWLASPALSEDERNELKAIANDEKEIENRFYGPLEFGTAGLRGTMYVGLHNMNRHVIRWATQGFANVIRAEGEEAMKKGVAICMDCRNHSMEFARAAACVMAGNGITVKLFESLRPTPELSFAVREYGCEAGINVTASHNPAQYNGYKVYGADGCQIGPETADAVLAIIEQLDYFTSPKYADFEEAKWEGKIIEIPDSCLEAFVDAVYAQRVGGGEGIENLKLVYTPLNGAGLECIRMLAKKLGVKNMTIVPEQEQPDGNFPTCPYPNPEIRQAMQKGLELCEKVKPDLLLGRSETSRRLEKKPGTFSASRRATATFPAHMYATRTQSTLRFLSWRLPPITRRRA